MPLNKEKVNTLETKLISEKAKIEAELEGLKERLDFGSDTDHFDTETDETEEKATYLGLKKVIDGRLRAIEKALDKIQKGGYGACEKCDNQIEFEVLENEPESMLCKNCKMSVK